MPRRTPKRDQLLDQAELLFEREGVRAVGIDRLIREAGVARMTLYNNFKGKAELVEAVLRRKDARCREELAAHVALFEPGEERVLAVFDFLTARFDSNGYCGCLFAKAVGEFAESAGSDEEARAICDAAADHKSQLIQFIRMLVAETGCEDPDEAALRLHLLIEGAGTQAQLLARGERGEEDARESVERAKDMARAVLARHLSRV